MCLSQDPPTGPHPVVLVGGDCSEACLFKYKGFKILLCILFAVFARVHVDNMEAGLVSVHGVENNLEDKGGSQFQPKAGGGGDSGQNHESEV